MPTFRSENVLPVNNAGAQAAALAGGLIGALMSTVAVPIPADLGWDVEGIDFGLVDLGSGRAYATASITPEALFDLFSTARSAPGVTYYVDVATGSDSNDGLSTGAKFKTIGKAITEANAGGVPAKVIVTAGLYARADALVGAPTVDIAFIATGGRVLTGVFDQFSAPSLDGTHTNCYSFSLANANRVVDLANPTNLGIYPDLKKVSTAAICNTKPGTWALVGGTIYIHRADGEAVTNANTRVYRASSSVSVTSNVSLFFGGVGPNDGFDMEGSNSVGVLSYSVASAPATRKAVVAKNCTFRYGGAWGVDGRGVSINGVHGIGAFFNCDASANSTDGFNAHNTSSGAVSRFLTVNCTGIDNGRGNNSCNGWTLHEDVIGVDLAGYYPNSHGCTVRNIDTSKAYMAGTFADRDLGDKMFGGGQGPTGFRVDSTSEMWCWRTKVNLPAGGNGYIAGNSGSKIHKLDVWPVALPDVAVAGATIDAWGL